MSQSAFDEALAIATPEDYSQIRYRICKLIIIRGVPSAGSDSYVVGKFILLLHVRMFYM